MPKHSTYSQQTLSDGATINWDLSLAQNAVVTLGGNRTLANPTNQIAGGVYTLLVKQDATGGRTLAFGTAYKWGTEFQFPGLIGVDVMLRCYSDGTTMYISATYIDNNVNAFVSSTGITNQVQINALNYLSFNLKTAALWTKLHALWPIIGDTAAQHSYNLVNPALYQLTYSGGITHAVTGIKGNGSTGFANTNFAPSTISGIQNNAAFGHYVRTTETGIVVDMGVFQAATTRYMSCLRNRGGGNEFIRVNDNSGSASDTIGATYKGSYILSRTASTGFTDYLNGTAVSARTETSVTPNTINMFLMALNTDGTATNHSPRTYGLFFISQGLTAGEVSLLHTIIQQYQTILGRNV